MLPEKHCSFRKEYFLYRNRAASTSLIIQASRLANRKGKNIGTGAPVSSCTVWICFIKWLCVTVDFVFKFLTSCLISFPLYLSISYGVLTMKIMFHPIKSRSRVLLHHGGQKSLLLSTLLKNETNYSVNRKRQHA